MRVGTVSAAGNGSWVVGMVGARSERFRRVKVAHCRIDTQALPGGGA